jgi:hypothetical protein
VNDTERMQWVENDEYLYLQYQRAANKRKWLRANRGEIDALISATISGERRLSSGPTGRYLT